jgi:DNA-binding transcriptional regulator YiaG
LLAKIQEKIQQEGQVTHMATRLNTISPEVTLEIPEKHKAQWLKEVFEFTDTEMAHVLGISVETLRKWLKDETDKHAMELARFHRLLNLTQLAKGVIRPNRLGHWVHLENQAMGRLVPLNLLADAAGYDIVAAVVEDIRAGISD